MSRFRFRLAAPLRLARLRREELRRRLAEEIRREIELEEQIRRLREAGRGAAADVLARAPGGIGGDEFRQTAQVIEAARARAEILAREQRSVRQRLESARSELAGIGRRVQVLERLEREAHRAHRLALLKREQAEIDDLTLVRRGGSARGGRRER